jgi:hypothetical protein
MSGRPRLVEEGEPIYGSDSYSSSSNNNSYLSNRPTHSNVSFVTGSSKSRSTTAKSGLSSLQQAAASTGGMPNLKPKKKSKVVETSFVIGGGDTVNDDNDDDMMLHSSPTSSPRKSQTTSFAISGDETASHMLPALWEQSVLPEKYTRIQTRHHGHAHQKHYHQNPPGNANYHDPCHYYSIHDPAMADNHVAMMEEDLHNYHAQPNSFPLHSIMSPQSNPSVATFDTTLSPVQAHPRMHSTTTTQTSFVIGEMETNEIPSATQQQHHMTLAERMEGVEDMGTKAPLVVLDGANVAHYYAQAMATMQNSQVCKPEPDAQGIQVATDYFLQCGVRVLVVLPQYWFRSKLRDGVNNASPNALMETTPQLEILLSLKERGLIVASPPTDDDDAYALTIARREEIRSMTKRKGEGPGFVLSNDLFRDAQARDPSGSLKQWLTEGRHKAVGAGRISYTFGDVGTMNGRGEHILDFIPNPRHPLVLWMEAQVMAQQHQE